ncbi:Type 1 glutamine amidotransferase-like domain-containing protein [soil metagenome]
MATRRIVALGGHEFRSRPSELAVVEHLLGLVDSARPKICLLPTASGDPQQQISDFHSVMSRFECEPTHLSLFRLEHNGLNPRDHLLAQDVVYVAGGSMLNLLAIWRAHGLPAIMLEAREAGVVLAGQSAGAMCWFEQGITASSGSPRAAPGLGLLKGSLCVHYERNPDRRSAYLTAVGQGLPGGFALDDGAGLLFEDESPVEAFAGRQGARVLRVASEAAEAQEMELHPNPLRYEMGTLEDLSISELRQLRRSVLAAGSRRAAVRVR